MQQSLPPSVRPYRLLCAAMFAALAGGAAAASDSYPQLGFSGFGTAGVAHASVRDADFTSSILKYSGAGRSDRWSPHVDSRLGVQLDAALNPRWSAVLQALSEQGSDGSYRPRIEWANLKYQATADLSLRFGRIALPVFLAADYRKIGYTYSMIRPPVEVYNAIPLSHSDGVDASYRWNHGAVKNTTQGFFGSTSTPLWDNATFRAHGIAGLSHTTHWGASTIRASILKADLSIDLARPLFDGYRQFGAPGARLAQRYDIEHRRVHSLSLGFNHDPGHWFVTGEIGRFRSSSSYLGDTDTGYLSAGYRLGDFTPFASYATVNPDSPTSDPGLDLQGMTPDQAYLASTLNANLNRLLSTIAAQSTFSVGARWDVASGVALTIQYDQLRQKEHSRGSLITVADSFRPGAPVHVASAAIDFVF